MVIALSIGFLADKFNKITLVIVNLVIALLFLCNNLFLMIEICVLTIYLENYLLSCLCCTLFGVFDVSFAVLLPSFLMNDFKEEKIINLFILFFASGAVIGLKISLNYRISCFGI